MTDTRARITQTGKTINLAQLASEAGGPLSASSTEIVSADGTLTAPQLQTAYDAHVADPNFGLPLQRVDGDTALGQLIQLAGGQANVRAKLKAVLAGTDTLTPAQSQRLLAAVALYALRDRTDS